ncbi:MAG: GNAT family N-acetyltransferase [Bacteroidota bacterium]
MFNNQRQRPFIIRIGTQSAGILMLTIDPEEGIFIADRTILLHKIYLLRQYSDMGIGQKTMDFVQDWAKTHHKEWVWLYTMKKGSALGFYLKNGFEVIKKKLLDYPQAKETEREMLVLAKKV